MHAHDEPPSTLAPADFDRQRAAIVAARWRRRARLDKVLAGLVLVLAAGLASVPIRDSGIWTHLAAGRQLVHSTADDSPGPRWASPDPAPATAPGWLFDVGCYAVYQTTGAVGLGLLKASVVVLLAAVLLWAGWSHAGGWFAATCTALALLAVAPWLELQPGLISLVFLALTLGYLERGRMTRPWIALAPLFGLFALWVNVDAWFLLGPCVLACYAFAGRRKTSANNPIVAVLVGFLVCLANPQVLGAFRLPAELALRWHGAALVDDPVYRALLLSPFNRGYVTAGPLWSAAGLALALLAVAGVGALVLNRAGRNATRLLVCAGLLGLGLYQAQLLPILAVALAALVPRGLAEFAEAHRVEGAVGELRLRQAVTGRAGTVVALAALTALTTLGRLPGMAPAPHGWGIMADPSLMRAAESLTALREGGILGPASRGFCYAPDVADYLAWYDPQEGSVADRRHWQSVGAAHDIVTVRQGLVGRRLRPDRSAPGGSDWRSILRGAGVDHVILTDLDGQRMQAILYRVLAEPAEWTVLAQTGRVVVLGWSDPALATPPTWRHAALDHDGLHPPTAEWATASAPSQADPAWWELLLPDVPTPSFDRDDADMRLMLFEALRRPTALLREREWTLALVAGAAGQALVGDAAGVALRLDWLATNGPARLAMDYRFHGDEAPVGHLWAAVRACRRAVATDPRDADAYLLLGDAYCRLCWSSAERAWETRWPLLRQLRRQQAIAVLRRAVQLRPDSIPAHARLVALYQQSDALDFALKHMQAFERIQHTLGPQPGESAKEFAARIEAIQRDLQMLDRDVAARYKAFASSPGATTVVARAERAAKLGLAEYALDLVLGATGDALGRDGLRLELELLLLAGRVEDGRAWLDPGHHGLLGDRDYHRLAAQLAAAAGDYAEADKHLRDLVVRSAPVPEFGPQPVDLEMAIAVTVATGMLAGGSDTLAPQPLLATLYGGLEPRLRLEHLTQTMLQSAQFALLRGAVALEHGDADQAARLVDLAWTLSTEDAADATRTGIRPVLAYYRNLLAHPPRAQ